MKLKKNNRNSKLVNKQLQFSLVFKSTIVMTIALVFLLSGLGAFIYCSNSQIVTKIDAIEKAVDTEKDIVKAFLLFSNSIENTELSLESQKIKAAHDKSMSDMESHILFLKSGIDFNIKFYLLFLGTSIISLLLLLYTIFCISHRIAGPVHLVTNGLRQFREGEKPEIRQLRKKDFCKDLFDEYLKLVKRS